MVRNECTPAASFYSKLAQTLVPGSVTAQLWASVCIHLPICLGDSCLTTARGPSSFDNYFGNSGMVVRSIPTSAIVAAILSRSRNARYRSVDRGLVRGGRSITPVRVQRG
jgi:hypothetical protein